MSYISIPEKHDESSKSRYIDMMPLVFLLWGTALGAVITTLFFAICGPFS